MSLYGLSLRDLQYLVAVAETGHFGRAAQICHVSQPGLSAQIKKLEGLLNVRVFERSNRRVEITPQGGALIAQARRTLAEAEKMFQLVNQNRPPLSESLRLGAVHTIGPYLIPYFLDLLRTEFPQLDLRLKEGLGVNLISELKHSVIDAVLIPDFHDDSIVTIPLFFEPFVVFLPSEHPLVGVDPLLPKDLTTQEMVLLEDGHCLKNDILNLCPSYRNDSSGIYQATSIETLKYVVASGKRYTLLPQLAITSDPRLEKLTSVRSFSGKPLGRSICLAYRKQYPYPADMEILARTIKTALSAQKDLNGKIFLSESIPSLFDQVVQEVSSISKYFNWVGIYLLKDGLLHLGPYQGLPTKYTEIKVGDGVCGRAVKESRDLNIKNVHKESNYLSCSLETQSELVVLLRNNQGEIIGLIDIDSNQKNAFGSIEEKAVRRVANRCEKALLTDEGPWGI